MDVATDRDGALPLTCPNVKNLKKTKKKMKRTASKKKNKKKKMKRNAITPRPVLKKALLKKNVTRNREAIEVNKKIKNK